MQWGIFLLACAGLFAAYVSALSVPGIGLAGDDGAYVVTGKALAEGRGYRIISQPNEPAQTKYPVLFPALIACIWKLFPEFPANALALKLIAFCFCAAWWVRVGGCRRDAEGKDAPAGLCAISIICADSAIISDATLPSSH